jgi:uncharacterized protein (TIGR03000 family)
MTIADFVQLKIREIVRPNLHPITGGSEMYTAVLMLAMTTGAESIDHGRRNCSGCYGCSGRYVACSGCYSSCCGGYYRAGYAGYYGSGPYYASGGYYAPNVAMQGAPTDGRRSFYFDPSQKSAMIRVLLPSSDAEVWFGGAPTKQRGMERMFASPALEPGSYKYTVKGRWTEDGRAVDRERTIEVRPGQPLTVDFRIKSGENLPAPKTKTPEQVK